MSDTRSLADPLPSIACEVVPVKSLTTHERQELFALISNHFEGLSETQFFNDLDEKRSVLHLREVESGRLCGFSTITLRETTFNDQPLAAVIAGDTIIEPAYWGHPGWLHPWAAHAFELAAQSTAKPVYLLLLTSTHRSYRFLPGFFREYYPRPDQFTPETIQSRLDHLVRLKFPDEYDPRTRVVSLREPTPVRAEHRDPAAQQRGDLHAQFFLAINPHYERGDFLTCLAELSWDNLTRLGNRIVRGA